MKKALPLALAIMIAAPTVTTMAATSYETQVEWGVNFRSAPSTDGTKYRMLSKGEYIHVIQEVNNNWLQVETKNGQVGYISANSKYTDYGEQTSSSSSGTITKGVNFRSSPKVTNNKIGFISKGSTVEVLEVTNSYWVKVRHNGNIGYVSADYISTTSYTAPPAANPPVAKPPVQSESKADQIIDFAKSLQGKVTYEFGVRNASRMIFDCSSFTQYVFDKHGVDMKWGTRFQKSAGKAVSKSNLAKGDLIFFATSGSSINHVGIYIGNGEFIHNKPSTNGVAIDTINSGYWKNKYKSARRVL